MMRALDQNQLSNKQLILSCQDSFLIPDITWFENTKADGWRDDIQRSFEVFHKDSSRLHIAYPIGVLLRRELQTRTPIIDPIDWEGTDNLRKLLRQPDYITSIEANISLLQKSGLEPDIHLAESRKSLNDGMTELTETVGREQMSELRAMHRNSKPPLSAFAPSIAALAKKNVKHTLTELGLRDADLNSLNTHQSAFYRVQFCFWAQIFQFAMCSSLISNGDKTLLNDIVDSDYAITASYCDALETSDDRLRQRYDALIATIWQAA